MFTTLSELSARAALHALRGSSFRRAHSTSSASARLALAGKIMMHVPRIMSIMDTFRLSIMQRHRAGRPRSAPPPGVTEAVAKRPPQRARTDLRHGGRPRRQPPPASPATASTRPTSTPPMSPILSPPLEPPAVRFSRVLWETERGDRGRQLSPHPEPRHA